MCPDCDGSGVCPWCSGAGTLPPNAEGEILMCQQCRQPGDETNKSPGDGVCATCQGTGILSEG